jgi:adenylate cyclase
MPCGIRRGSRRCATEVQNGMIERNAGPPDDRRIEFRVGVHLGEVVEEENGNLIGAARVPEQ